MTVCTNVWAFGLMVLQIWQGKKMGWLPNLKMIIHPWLEFIALPIDLSCPLKTQSRSVLCMTDMYLYYWAYSRWNKRCWWWNIKWREARRWTRGFFIWTNRDWNFWNFFCIIIYYSKSAGKQVPLKKRFWLLKSSSMTKIMWKHFQKRLSCKKK